MSRKLFGTDGVRGRANSYPMTAEMALRLGAAAGRYFRRKGEDHHRVVIGKDTRLSGYLLENASDLDGHECAAAGAGAYAGGGLPDPLDAGGCRHHDLGQP